jgi:hypothetical protein
MSITEAPADPAQVIEIQIRRARWFSYVRRRFDLVSLEKIAEWVASLATEPRGVRVAPDLKVATLNALFESIHLGDFGGGEWPALAYLPGQRGSGGPIPADRVGSFPLRLSLGQLARLGPTWVSDLWAPRAACIGWLEARGIHLAAWLRMEPGTEASPKAARVIISKGRTQEEVNAWVRDHQARAKADGRPLPKILSHQVV